MAVGAIGFLAYLGYWLVIPVVILTALTTIGLHWVTRDVHIVVSSRVTYLLGFLCGAITFALVVLGIWAEEIVRWWKE